MTDISPQADYEDDNDDEIVETNDLLPDIWVETDTGLLYECRFFDTFVLVRPAAPAFYLAIKKISMNEFTSKFQEFSGNLDEVRDMIRGATPDFIVEKNVNRK